MTATFPAGYLGILTGEELNAQINTAQGATGPTGPTGATGPTGPTGPLATHAVTYGTTGAIPTSDPHVVGQIWSNSGTVTISAG